MHCGRRAKSCAARTGAPVLLADTHNDSQPASLNTNSRMMSMGDDTVAFGKALRGRTVLRSGDSFLERIEASDRAADRGFEFHLLRQANR